MTFLTAQLQLNNHRVEKSRKLISELNERSGSNTIPSQLENRINPSG